MFKNEKKKKISACFFFREKSFFPNKQACFFRVATLERNDMSRPQIYGKILYGQHNPKLNNYQETLSSLPKNPADLDNMKKGSNARTDCLSTNDLTKYRTRSHKRAKGMTAFQHKRNILYIK